ncbi:C40 family peptidase [Coleofasciculus sp. LEGE 07081]|uniref:C40 family peptidase n=1 Tax=unclassified Coleofasciculus TaxID=2692782 RepID=UPI00187FD6DE|nr:C40 family peptidase [Coleofasciculus sp. LEGE 07081]MBE9149574.1 C40 family peptidase [Coleofasciculus sp. LEGE 07092]
MVLFEKLPESQSGEYCCRSNLNLYDSPTCDSLATQAAGGRQLQILSSTPVEKAIEMRLCEDGYSAWLPLEDIAELEPAAKGYQAIALSPTQIQERVPAIIAFTKQAMQQPNYYHWGGTVAPNYDCSGLMQAGFAASGIWLPRDSYQQEAFTQTLEIEELLPGDLIFFGTPEKTNHVGLYLGDGYYIHSSGRQTGRNGIGIDQLSEHGDKISQFYYRQLRKLGRVVANYQGNSRTGKMPV